MSIKNVFLLIIQLFFVLFTSVCMMLSEEPRQQLPEIEKPPYVLDKGFNTLLCHHHNITLQDAITNSPQLKECPCTRLGRELVFAVTMVKMDDERLFTVGIPLEAMNYDDNPVVSYVKNAIADNNGVVLFVTAYRKSDIQFLPIIVPGSRDIQDGKEILDFFLNYDNKSS